MGDHKNRQINQLLELEPEFDVREDKEYKIKVIKDNAIYDKAVKGQVSGLYYIVSWKSYLEDENTWESAFVIL